MSNNDTNQGITNLTRQYPAATDVEKVVIGTILIESRAVYEVIEKLKHPSYFYDQRNREIFKVILELHKSSTPIDIITVAHGLKKTGKLKEIGGPSYLSELTSQVNSSAHLINHCLILMEMWARRAFLEYSNQFIVKFLDESQDIFKLIDNAQESVLKIQHGMELNQSKGINQHLQTAFESIAQDMNKGDGITGLSSGFISIDKITGGFQRGDFIILAARPSMGKTTLAINFLLNCATLLKKPVGIFSLEVSAEKLTKKMIATVSEISTSQLMKGKLTEHEFVSIQNTAANALYNAPIYIEDTTTLTLASFLAKVYKLYHDHHIELLVVDYLQLMSVGSTEKSINNREQEISIISRTLKNLAQALDIPVIAISQLSRAVETRGGNKKPQLSDLRESGSLEQDADLVAFLYRPEYYGINEYEDGASTEGIAELLISKHRQGPLAEIKLKADLKHSRFLDLEEETDLPSFNQFRSPYDNA